MSAKNAEKSGQSKTEPTHTNHVRAVCPKDPSHEAKVYSKSGNTRYCHCRTCASEIVCPIGGDRHKARAFRQSLTVSFCVCDTCGHQWRKKTGWKQIGDAK